MCSEKKGAMLLYPDFSNYQISYDFLSEDENYISEILNGTKDGLPLLSGYRLSYKIVYEFLDKNPKITVKEWTDMSAENILKKSGYLER